METYNFLPVSKSDMQGRGWYYYDFLLVTGDAYVDHPSFGAAVIGRVLDAEGYRVAVLAQPGWRNADDFKSMGRPRYAALITSGNLDSMVAHYTAAKKPRKEDYYSPGKKAGFRPDRAVIVYSNLVREAFPGLPLILGGLEASLRRFAHYDYWDDKVRRPILFDAKADFLVYGMGEAAICELAERLAKGESAESITDVRGTGYIAAADGGSAVAGKNAAVPCPFRYVKCASFEAVSGDKRAYAKAVMTQHDEHDPLRGRAVMQSCGGRLLVVNPPSKTLSAEELDRIYELPYTRECHPMYKEAGGVPAIEEVRFSITHTRGCFGACNFCALAFHQGRVVSSRSSGSVIREAEELTRLPDFKGYIHDVGGPTANFRHPSCKKQLKHGLCKLSSPNSVGGAGGAGCAGGTGGAGITGGRAKTCLAPVPCKNLDTDHKDYMLLLRKLAALPGVKKVFVRSGIRFDYLMLDKNGEFFTQLVKNHISGQLKVAPEHCADDVLMRMGKPSGDVYRNFADKFDKLNRRFGKKQFLVPYLMSSHPGSTLEHAVELALFLKSKGHQPEQVQDFYPTPGTLSTCMYYTGIDPRDMSPVCVPRTPREKAMQRALLQWKNPKNRELCREALKLAGREDLIGSAARQLVPAKKHHKAAPGKR